MRNKPTFILSLLAASCMVSCKKEPVKELTSCITINNANSYSTVQPSDYVMAYPGSWWKFDNGKTDSISSSWKTMLVTQSSTKVNGCQVVNKDWLLMPRRATYPVRYISLDAYVEFKEDNTPVEYVPFISETPGVIYEKTIPSPNGDKNAYKTTSHGKLQSLTVGSTTYQEVIHMSERRQLQYSGLGFLGPVYNYEYYYAKHVGLIRKIIAYQDHISEGDTTDLVDYYIAPH